MISLSRCMAVLYTIGALKNMLFILPVLMLYYGYKGVSMGDFYLIQGLSAMVVFLLEVPSGYIADIFSRKKTVILGMIVWVLGYLFWIFGDGFWFILMGELIFGVSLSLLSGALEAYIYDLLKKRKKEKSFHKKMAKYDMFTDLSLLFATLSGPFIYKEIGEDATVWFCVITMVVAIVLMCFMPDTPETKREVKENKSAFLDILEISIKTVKNYDIRNIIVFSGIYGTLTLVLMWGLQSVMMDRDVPVYLFGVILAINAFGRAICHQFGHRYRGYEFVSRPHERQVFSAQNAHGFGDRNSLPARRDGRTGARRRHAHFCRRQRPYFDRSDLLGRFARTAEEKQHLRKTADRRLLPQQLRARSAHSRCR